MLETISITAISEILWKKARVVFPEIRIRLGCFLYLDMGVVLLLGVVKNAR